MEQAFNFIISHNYSGAFERFKQLFNEDKKNSSYMNGCIVSLILMENNDLLSNFIERESASREHRDLLLALRGKIEKHNSQKNNNRSSVFELLVSCIDSMRVAGLDSHIDVYVKTAHLLRPDDPSLYRYMAEMAFKNNLPVKGCSYLVKASINRFKAQ